MTSKNPSKPQSPAPRPRISARGSLSNGLQDPGRVCSNPDHRMGPGDPCEACGWPIGAEPGEDDGIQEIAKALQATDIGLGDKLDELQWRILTRVDKVLLDYCSDGQYLLVVRIGRGVASSCAASTDDKDRLVVTVMGQEVSLDRCCEFCAKPATCRGYSSPMGAELLLMCDGCIGGQIRLPL